MPSGKRKQGLDVHLCSAEALANGSKLTEWKLPRQLVTTPGV